MPQNKIRPWPGHLPLSHRR